MNTETEALARRAVACPAWRWLPGMLVKYTGPETDLHPKGLALETRVRRVNWIEGQGDLPDLSDPPTLGALLALVREAFGPTFHLIPQGGWLTQGARLPNGATVNLGICEATEAAALVAALEAAP